MRQGKLEAFLEGCARQFHEDGALTVALFSEELFRDLASVTSLINDAMENHAPNGWAIVREGQTAGGIRSDLPSQHVVMLLTGPRRLMIAGWKARHQADPSLVQSVATYWDTFTKIVTA